MTGSRELIQLTSLNLQDLNFKLQRISDRLDAIEGLRGLPNMYSTLDMNLNKIVDVLDPTDPNDAAILDTFQAVLLTGLDAILDAVEIATLTITGDTSTAGDITMNDGFIEVKDADSTIIHSFGVI